MSTTTIDRLLEIAERFMHQLSEESVVQITTIERTPDGPLTTEKRAIYQHGKFTVETPKEEE